MASSEGDSIAGSATADSPANMDAKAKREARKARILSSGTDRLARITKTGRGGEADTLYSDPVPKYNANASTSSSSGSGSGGKEGRKSTASMRVDRSDDSIVGQDEDFMAKRAQAAMQGGLVSSDDDPQDIDISQSRNMDMSNSLFPAGQMEAEMPQDLQGMMKFMQSAMMGGAAGNGQQQQQQLPPGFPFGLGAGAESGAGGTEKGVPSKTPQQQQQTQSSTAIIIDTVFNLLRVGIFFVFGIALVYGALNGPATAQYAVPEDESAASTDKFERMTMLHRWARLAYERPAHWESRYFGVESLGLPIHGIPVFWLFLTLEVALQSSRIMLQRSRPAPPGFLLKASSYIPNAHIRLLIRTLASYLPLLDSFVNDLSIVVFTIGCTIIFAAWRSGLDPILASSNGAFGESVALQTTGDGSIASKVVDSIAGMQNPSMGDLPPVQAAL